MSEYQITILKLMKSQICRVYEQQSTRVSMRGKPLSRYTYIKTYKDLGSFTGSYYLTFVFVIDVEGMTRPPRPFFYDHKAWRVGSVNWNRRSRWRSVEDTVITQSSPDIEIISTFFGAAFYFTHPRQNFSTPIYSLLSAAPCPLGIFLSTPKASTSLLL